jgi:ABC-type antimicrobial peptide transport system permease subunit
LVPAGIAVGFVIALSGGRLIESRLYAVSARDPGVFATTTFILLAVALLACWLPAQRAARLNRLRRYARISQRGFIAATIPRGGILRQWAAFHG